MKIVVVGGGGFIGRRLLEILREAGEFELVSVSRRASALPPGVEFRQADVLDLPALANAVCDADWVVNCVAGDAKSIGLGAESLTAALLSSPCRQLVHLSSMAVYGARRGAVDERADLSGGGWYAAAKLQAEEYVRRFTFNGGGAVIFRPGCVYGPGGQLWVGRIARLLRQRRLGDLGEYGDGWTNLVFVDDVCRAVLNVMQAERAAGDLAVYNLTAADSPRWNRYFTDLALALGATPLRRLGRRQLALDAYALSPALQLSRLAARRLGLRDTAWEPLPPGLLRFFGQEMIVDSGLARRDLGWAVTPYALGLARSVEWFLEQKPEV